MNQEHHDIPNTSYDNGATQQYAAPVAGEQTAYRRRRRSERYQNDENLQESVAPVQPQAVPVTQPQEPAVQPLQGRSAARRSVPGNAPLQAGQSVPRPAVLNRAAQQGMQQPASAAPRRPVNAPGYSQRQPVSARPPMQQEMQPVQPRRPVVVQDYDDYDEPRKPRKGRGWLVALVIVVLVLGLLVLGFLLIPENDTSIFGQIKQTVTSAFSGILGTEEKVEAEIFDFAAAPVQGTAPQDVALTVTSSLAAKGVRVVDQFGEPLETTTSFTMDNADSRITMLNLAVTDGFEGLVQAQVQDERGLWINSGKTVQLQIMAAPQATATQVPAAQVDVPTQTPLPVMAVVATATPTVPPTAAPSQEPEATQNPADAVPVMSEATPTPTIEPTAVPTEAPTPTPTPTPEPTEAPTPAPKAEAADSANPKLIADSVIYEGTKKVETYNRPLEDIVQMPAGDEYTTLPYGVMTFRGNAFRQNAASGTASENAVTGLELAWTAEAGSVKGSKSTYYGIGWYGQPAIVKWSKEIREHSNIVEEKRSTSALKEVIIAGLDGRIYFLDLEDGQPTRDAINLGYPMKSTPSIHSLGYPVMTVGQYARQMASGSGKIGLRFYNLLDQDQEYMIDGLDGKNERPYYSVGAFDSSALIDPNTDTLVAIGTNGMLYVVDLNTELDVSEFKLSIDPEIVSMKSRISKQKNAYVAVESSLAMYANYAYYADMDGILRCVDTSTMTTVWAVDTGDAVQAAIALDQDEEGNVWLYTGNTMQNRTKGSSQIRRFNALTGEEDWEIEIGVSKHKTRIHGMMASPVIGQNSLSELAYFTVTGLTDAASEDLLGEEGVEAVLIAVNKESGKIVWEQELGSYAYSSPVAVYSDYGDGWIIQAESNGTITLYEGLTGDKVSSLKVEGTIEGSPAVYRDTLVIGTTGKNTSYIYGVKLLSEDSE